MSKGYVYVLTNPAMPGLVKIGKTTRSVDQRASELYQTGVPQPFEVVHHVYSPDCHALESYVHALFAAERVSGGREFFAVSEAEAIDALRHYLEYQLETLVSEFLPDCKVVPFSSVVPSEAVSRLAADMGETPSVISSAMSMLTAEEMRMAVRRWKAWITELTTKSDEGAHNG